MNVLDIVMMRQTERQQEIYILRDRNRQEPSAYDGNGQDVQFLVLVLADHFTRGPSPQR